MQTTTNLALKKPDDTDYFSRTHQNDNMEAIDAAITSRINQSLLTTNIGNAYTTIGNVTGSVVPIKFNADSTGAVTINGKALLLPGGAAAVLTTLVVMVLTANMLAVLY